MATPFRISGTLGDASKHAFRAVALVMLRAKLADRHLASDHYCSDWWPRYKPLIFNNGVQIAFPPPTRTERLWTSLDLNMSEMKCWFWVDRSSRLGLLLWSCQDNQGTKSSYQPRSSRIQGGGRFASRPCLRTLIGGEHLRMRTILEVQSTMLKKGLQIIHCQGNQHKNVHTVSLFPYPPHPFRLPLFGQLLLSIPFERSSDSGI